MIWWYDEKNCLYGSSFEHPQHMLKMKVILQFCAQKFCLVGCILSSGLGDSRVTDCNSLHSFRVKQFGLTFCWAWSGPKLFVEVISRWQKSRLQGRDVSDYIQTKCLFRFGLILHDLLAAENWQPHKSAAKLLAYLSWTRGPSSGNDPVFWFDQ